MLRLRLLRVLWVLRVQVRLRRVVRLLAVLLRRVLALPGLLVLVRLVLPGQAQQVRDDWVAALTRWRAPDYAAGLAGLALEGMAP